MRHSPSLLSLLFLVPLAAATPVASNAQMVRPSVAERATSPAGVPDLAQLVSRAQSPMRAVVERYVADRGALQRRYDTEWSASRRSRLRELNAGWRERLAEIDYASLDREAQLDYLLLDNRLRYELALLEREERQTAEMAALLPFAERIAELQLARRRLAPTDPAAAARALDSLTGVIARTRSAVGASIHPTPIVAFRALGALQSLHKTLTSWHGFHAGYDPLFTWWTTAPHGKADSTLQAYAKHLRETVLGIRAGREEPIIADPIGADGMRADLAYEMLPYTPQEMIAIAEREFAWSEAEMRKAAREMGFSNWRDALERVKTLHVEPGQQTALARELAQEAVEFLESHDLVTVPPLAKEVWRMEMLSPERQRVAPFFLGGEVLLVAFPTAEMEHDEKLMSLRGNNRHFSRAVVHHELIPGHHLQGFMAQRYNEHRRAFSTPFYSEGWALYWEMLLWDLGFARSPEDRVGMLFWRMHRSARIIFSLRVHLGTMTPPEAIDFLVERVGHERANASAEVRRSFNGTYPPLYQVAYMLGGLQLRALHRELVGSGRMTDREFHDAVLQSGPMPVELVRARLLGLELPRTHRASWRFADR